MKNSWKTASTAMARLLFAIATGLILAGNVDAQRARPQPPSAADSAAVRRAALDYVDAIYRVDTTLVVRSVRPELAKRGYYIPQGQSAYVNSPMNFAQLLNTARTWNAQGRVDADRAIKEVTILDLLDQTASVKLVAEWGIDYMHLAKYDGRWMIVNVLWQTHPRPASPPAVPQSDALPPPPGEAPDHAVQCESAPARATILAQVAADSGRLYRGTLSPDGRTLYYFKKVTPNQEDYRIFVTRLVNGQWTEPQKIALGGDHSELYPTISPDGNRIVFSSYRLIPSDTFSYKNAHLWYADRQGTGWGTPVFMAEATEIGHYHSGPRFQPDGSVTFNRTTPDWRTGTTLVTRWSNGRYGPAERVTELDRWRGFRSDIHVWGAQWSPDRRAVLLEVARIDPATRRPGATDFWVALRTGNGWSEPRPLGAGVNTELNEQFASFSADGCRLIFTRNYSTLQEVSFAAAVADSIALSR